MNGIDPLIDLMRSYGSVLIAFSGGIDSGLVAAAAVKAGIEALAVTARSPLVPEREVQHALKVARSLGILHRIIQGREWEIEAVRNNSRERCYHCKRARLSRLLQIAREEGLAVVADGSQLDDLGEYRPGMKAVSELGVKSPLIEVGLDKNKVREASRELGIADFPRPAKSCLATRFPYDTILEEENLARIDRAENFLEEKGFSQVRVRWENGHRVRIEVEVCELARIIADPLREEVLKHFNEIGFRHVTLDLKGYRSGSMDEEP
jgi:uncharacterized protein